MAKGRVRETKGGKFSKSKSKRGTVVEKRKKVYWRGWGLAWEMARGEHGSLVVGTMGYAKLFETEMGAKAAAMEAQVVVPIAIVERRRGKGE